MKVISPSKFRHITATSLIEHNGLEFPEAPRDWKSTGIDKDFLADLALKTTQALTQCTSKWVAEQMHLPMPLVEERLEQMARDHWLEVLGQEGPFNHRYAISHRGHDRALRRALENRSSSGGGGKALGPLSQGRTGTPGL